MKLLVAFVLLFVVSVLSQGTPAQDGVWNFDTEIGTDQPRNLLYYIHNDSPDTVLNVSVAFIPCFGAVDIYVGFDYIPSPNTPNENFYHIPWDNTKFLQQFMVPYVYTNDTIYFLFQADNTYSGQSVSAVFQFVIWTTYSTGFSVYTKFPQVNNIGLTSTIASGGGSGTVKWQKTSNPSDNYTVWYSTVNSKSFNSDTTGNYSLTGCSVERFFLPFTNDISIKDNGDGTITAALSNLNGKVITPVTVVVTREEGTSAAYETIYFNNGNLNCMSWIALLVALITLMF